MTTSQPAFDAGECIWRQREQLASVAPRLRQLLAAIDRPELPVNEATQLYAIASDFRPTLILEVGRLYGNSTSILTEYANSQQGTQVLSVCLSSEWLVYSVPRLQSLVEPNWFSPLEVKVGDVCQLDAERVLAGHARVLVLWDAHGWNAADFLLSRLLPALAGREHVVVVHDIAELEFSPEGRSYMGGEIWKGAGNNEWLPCIVIGGKFSPYPEFVALSDFAERNGIPLHSVEREIRHAIENVGDRRREMELQLENLYDPRSRLQWIRLDGDGQGATMHFPSPGPFGSSEPMPRRRRFLEGVIAASPAGIGRALRRTHRAYVAFRSYSE